MLGQLHDSDIKLLRVFSVIAKYGSFHAAQVELNISQASISTQVKHLETRLGRRLCHRGRAGFELTDEGRSLLMCAEKLFIAIDDFRNNLAEEFNELKGELQLGVIDNLINHPQWQLALVLSKFNKIAPSVSIKLQVYTAKELESRVLDSSLQFAISSSANKLATLNYQTLFEETQQLYCGKQHPLFNAKNILLSPEQLQNYDYFNWDYLEPFFIGQHQPFNSNKGGSASLEAVAYAILSGQYLGYLPEYYAQQWLNSGQLKEIHKDLKRSMPIMLVTKKIGKQSSISSLFIKELLATHQAM